MNKNVNEGDALSACYRSVSSDGERLHLDTADTLAVGDGELDVALVTPSGVPGVLDHPVVEASSGVVAPSGDEHGVVQGGATPGVIKDTGGVELEDKSVGLD